MSNLNYEFTLTNISCPVENVMGIWEFKRPPYFKYLCYSLSGHLLHLVTQGSYLVKINGVSYNVTKGDVIYYYETEEVETIGNESEVIFYSVSYQASKVNPPSLEDRVFKADKKLRKLFKNIYREFSSNDQTRRSFMIHSYLLKILSYIGSHELNHNLSSNENELWWDIENRLRRKKHFRPSLDNLLEISGYSRSTLNRLSKKATGVSPLHRIRIIRMEEARSLLSFSKLNVSQVAARLGYPRIHEFSREFSKYYGEPPSALLKNV